MKLQVLIATMNQKSIEKLVDDMNITTDAIVANQTNNTNSYEFKHNENLIRAYNFEERGAARNRNRALDRATSDVVILADDDLRYVDNYEEIILTEFEKNPQADVIVFNIDETDSNMGRFVITDRKRIHRYNCLRYGAVRMAFKLDSVKNANIRFDEKFGPGALYTSGEDSIFIYSCISKKLKVYSCPEIILKLNKSESTWFENYNEKYFHDKGAIMGKIFGWLAIIPILLYLLKNRKDTKSVGFTTALKQMKNGCCEIQKNRSSNNDKI